VGQLARRLADEHGRAVRVVYTREDVVRLGPKRPPLAAGVDVDGSGVVRVARTAGIAEAIGRVAPGLAVEEVDVLGPPTSVAARGAGWVEAAVLLSSLGTSREIRSPDGAVASASVDDGGVSVTVRCGDRSTKWCCARTASAPPTWRSDGCATKVSPSTNEGEPHD
jgi:hypothetical protein